MGRQIALKKDAPAEAGVMMTNAASSEMQQRYAGHLATQQALAPKLKGDTIHTGATGFKINDTRLGTELDVIILGFSYTSSFYGIDQQYDPDNPSLPICYSVSRDPDDMVACDSVVDAEADSCGGCPYSKFKSATQGKGKACREYIRLAVISVDDLEEGTVPKVMYVNLPPTARKGFASFVANVNGALRIPLFGVVSQLYIEELKAAFSVGIELVGVIDDIELIEDIIEPLLENADKALFEDPKFSEMDLDDEAPAKPEPAKRPRKPSAAKPTPAKRERKAPPVVDVVEEVEAAEEQFSEEELNEADQLDEEPQDDAPKPNPRTATRRRNAAPEEHAEADAEDAGEAEDPVATNPTGRRRRQSKF